MKRSIESLLDYVSDTKREDEQSQWKSVVGVKVKIGRDYCGA